MARQKEWKSLLFTALISLIMLPTAFVISLFLKRKQSNLSTFFGMSVNFDKEPNLSPKLIDELGVEQILIRFPLSQIEKIDSYLEFVKKFHNRDILINIMQDRAHVVDNALLERNINRVFSTFSPYVSLFQIGSTINRSKWGFFSVREHLNFYRTVQNVRDAKYPKFKLLGPSVIDFEYHFTTHALFNSSPIFYDSNSSLLYVDRRGAPENTQGIFNLRRKISLLKALLLLSPKSGKDIYITETNWPISDTAPYAPTSEYECVSEMDYAKFMVRYYLLSMIDGYVKRVYWHQLIAAGYGLIDNRDGIRRREAFNAFKTMIKMLKNGKLKSIYTKNERYSLGFVVGEKELEVRWSLERYTLNFEHPHEVTNMHGETKKVSSVVVDDSPIYIHKKGV